MIRGLAAFGVVIAFASPPARARDKDPPPNFSIAIRETYDA